MEVTLDERGRLAIPQSILDGLGLKPGSRLEIRTDLNRSAIVLERHLSEDCLAYEDELLVFTGKAVGDLQSAVEAHRHRSFNEPGEPDIG